jgi:hypothetical protein
MWHFNTIDELRYDHLLGLRPGERPSRPPASSPRRRRYLLFAAARFCRWRDGKDPRRAALSEQDGARMEREMLYDLVPMRSMSQDHPRTGNSDTLLPKTDAVGL